MAAMEVDGLTGSVEEADVAELRSMLAKAKRPNVRAELERVLAQFEKALPVRTAEAGSAPAPAAAPEPAAPAPASSAPKPVPVEVKSAGPWTEITTFALDLGGYDKPAVTVDFRLKGVEALPAENVTCDFTEASFDLKVVGLDGLNHRFVRTNLEKDIVPAESSVKVKKNHVIVTLQKVKGQYGYDNWMDLCAKGKRKPTTGASKDGNPQDSIMGMMKDLYDEGDDSMKKIIGEAMYKAQRGEKYDPKPEDMKLPGDSDM